MYASVRYINIVHHTSIYMDILLLSMLNIPVIMLPRGEVNGTQQLGHF